MFKGKKTHKHQRHKRDGGQITVGFFLFPSSFLFRPQETAVSSACTCLCSRMMEVQECVRQLVETGRELRKGGVIHLRLFHSLSLCATKTHTKFSRNVQLLQQESNSLYSRYQPTYDTMLSIHFKHLQRLYCTYE